MKKGHFQNSRFAEIMSHDAFEVLDQRLIQSQKQPYPLTANAYFAKSKGTNLLAKMIAWQLRNDGHYTYRNNTTGVPRRMRDGSIKWVPGSTYAKGAGDIFSTINGRACFIEIKVGKDRVSEAQEKFKAGIEKSGGVYVVVRTFDEFLKEYKLLINN